MDRAANPGCAVNESRPDDARIIVAVFREVVRGWSVSCVSIQLTLSQESSRAQGAVNLVAC